MFNISATVCSPWATGLLWYALVHQSNFPFPSAATAQGFGYNECPEKEGVQTYPHPDDCNAFYLCVNGTLTEEYCENGLLFDGKGAVHNYCNYYWAVDCGERKADGKWCAQRLCCQVFHSDFQ